MKNLLVLALCLATAVSFSQDLKSMTKNTSMSSKLMNNDYIDKLASDQVGKLTKKLKLSEKQQQQASDLVMKQLRSEKFQTMLAKYTPDQLMSSMGSEQISSALMKDDSFKKGLNGILNEDQKKMMESSGMTKG